MLECRLYLYEPTEQLTCNKCGLITELRLCVCCIFKDIYIFLMRREQTYPHQKENTFQNRTNHKNARLSALLGPSQHVRSIVNSTELTDECRRTLTDLYVIFAVASYPDLRTWQMWAFWVSPGPTWRTINCRKVGWFLEPVVQTRNSWAQLSPRLQQLDYSSDLLRMQCICQIHPWWWQQLALVSSI